VRPIRAKGWVDVRVRGENAGHVGEIERRSVRDGRNELPERWAGEQRAVGRRGPVVEAGRVSTGRRGDQSARTTSQERPTPGVAEPGVRARFDRYGVAVDRRERHRRVAHPTSRTGRYEDCSRRCAAPKRSGRRGRGRCVVTTDLADRTGSADEGASGAVGRTVARARRAGFRAATKERQSTVARRRDSRRHCSRRRCVMGRREGHTEAARTEDEYGGGPDGEPTCCRGRPGAMPHAVPVPRLAGQFCWLLPLAEVPGARLANKSQRLRVSERRRALAPR